MSGAHSPLDESNKKVALLIAVLALFLAFAETFAKGAQTNALSSNVEASNLWSFFQAKTIRMTILKTASEALDVEQAKPLDALTGDAIAKRLDAWTKTAARWESEPETQEGRKELSARAKTAETQRDLALARYHHYEIASALFQIAIVLASATVITGITVLMWVSGGLGLIGLAIGALGFLAPQAVHWI